MLKAPENLHSRKKMFLWCFITHVAQTAGETPEYVDLDVQIYADQYVSMAAWFVQCDAQTW